MPTPHFVPLPERPQLSPERMLAEAEASYREMRLRRTVRDFSRREVPRAVIEWAIRTAGTAPSGANRQPWHFVAVGHDPELRARLRDAAEAEERRFYRERAPDSWLEALAHLGTDEHKPYLEEAPWLIAIFAERYGVDAGGERVDNYYVTESVGIATGLLVTALHRVGLATLTHTPSPMGFLNEVLDRPENERPFLLLVTGYPAEDATVPDITRKPLDEIATFLPPRSAKARTPRNGD